MAAVPPQSNHSDIGHMRVYNFSPGPAVLPQEVLEQAREEMLDWRGTGTVSYTHLTLPTTERV